VAGHVHVRDAFGGHLADEFERVIAVIDAIHINIIDVQVQPAIGFFHHGADELDFTHLIDRRHDVERGILHGDARFEDVLRTFDARRDVFHRVLGKGDRQQVIQVTIVAAIR